MSDPNMNTLREWATLFPAPDTLPEKLESNIEKLISIVDSVNSCLGKEFSEDRDKFIRVNTREPAPNEEYEVLCRNYEPDRKKQFLNCIRECISKEISEVEEKYLLILV